MIFGLYTPIFILMHLPSVLPVTTLLVLAMAPAAAQDAPAPAWTVSANTGIVSQYVSRGVRQSWGRPALQAGVDINGANGWSAGTWTSSVSERFIENASVEWDLYGGYSGAAGPFGYSAMLYVYRYPGAVMAASGTRYDYKELAFGVSYQSVSAKWYRTVSRDFFGIVDARGTNYFDVTLNHDLGHGYALNLHAGEGRVEGRGNDIWNWRDLKAGVSKSLAQGWSVGAALTGARGATPAYDQYTTGVPNASGTIASANVLKTTLVLSATRTF